MAEEIIKIMEMLSSWIRLHPELKIKSVFIETSSPDRYRFGVIIDQYYIAAIVEAHKIDDLYTHYINEFNANYELMKNKKGGYKNSNV